MNLKSAAFLLVCATTTACVIQTRGPAPIVHVTGSRPTVPTEVHEVAVSGVALRSEFIASVNADCSSRGVNKVSLVTEPSHGTVTIAQVDDYPSFPPTNQRYPCNKKKEPGIAVHYTSSAGYIGPDTFSLFILSPTGDPHRQTISIDVRPQGSGM